ncbi:hypothetical protein B0T16DRAFT_388352 [Cercophora newfieldiana]|uniref:Uncharacterized protein n=1 Tax=Cercophora newfieldiana TaxID=92897 RepID=A0AA39Y8K1_9PEZI|nr:hypothetical protein B0T16DRAFT_388352 [Cercophora newfieldiana]
MSKPNTIRRLHEYYMYGTSPLAAGLSMRSPSFIAVASILVFVLAIDGPILQRASSTALVVRETSDSNMVPVTLTIASQIPFGFTGTDFAGDYSPIVTRPLLNPDFASVFTAYNQRRPIPGDRIEAAGLWKVCNTTETKIVTPAMGLNETITAMTGRHLFGVDWEHHTKYRPHNFLQNGYTNISDSGGRADAGTIPDDEPYIVLSMTWSPAIANGSRSVFHKTCRLYSATCRYKIRIHNDTQESSTPTVDSSSSSSSISSLQQNHGLVSTNNTITLIDPPTFIKGTVQNVRRSVASLDIPPTHPAHPNWTDQTPFTLALTQPAAFFQDPACPLADYCPVYETLGGLVSTAQDILASNAPTMNPTGFLFLTGALANQLIAAPSDTGIDDVNPTCIGWDDPSAFVFSVLDEIVFGIAVDTARVDNLRNPARNGSDADKYKIFPKAQTVRMTQRRTTQVFVSNYAWLAGGMVVMFAAVVGVVPLFWGFWTLGRPMTMSPVEVAHAFGAPVMEGRVATNATAEEIAESGAGRVEVSTFDPKPSAREQIQRGDCPLRRGKPSEN